MKAERDNSYKPVDMGDAQKRQDETALFAT